MRGGRSITSLFSRLMTGKTCLHLTLIAIVGLAAYANTFDVPFQFDDFNNISANTLIGNIDNFISGSKGYDYNPRRYIGYLTFALNYHFGGLDVTSYHVVNLAIHILNAALVYFLVVLTFKTPYFSSQQSAVSDQQSNAKQPLSSQVVEGPNGRVVGRSSGTSQLLDDSTTQQPNFPSSFTIHYSLFTVHYSRFIALFAALLFVAHPIQTQAVTYIVQRFTSLATLFYLLSVVMYIKGRLSTVKSEELTVNSEKPDTGGRETVVNTRFTFHVSPFTIVCYLLSLLSAVLAMRTKEIAFTLPIIILLYEFTFFSSSLKKKLLFLLPILLTLIIIPASVLHSDKPLGEILSDLSEKTRVQTEISRGEYLMTEMRVIVTYIRLIFLPINQNLDYDYPIYHSFFTPPVLMSFLFLTGILGAAVWLMYKSRAVGAGPVPAHGLGGQPHELPLQGFGYSLFTIHYSRLIAFGILWFFITLSVESSFIPITDVIFEHRVYLPSAGAFITLAAIFFEAARRVGRRMPAGIVFITPLVIVLILTAVTYARNSVWKDGKTLWEDVIRKAPGNARAHNNLGFISYKKGMLDQARDQFITALRLRPQYSDARVNLGIIYNEQGMADLAIEQYMIVLSANHDDADAHNNLGIAYASRGMTEEAIAHYQTALRLNPDYPEAYNNLGVVYGNRGLFDDAIGYFSHAIKLNPDYFEAHFNLLRALLKKNDLRRAEVEYRYLLRINPVAAKNLWPHPGSEAR